MPALPGPDAFPELATPTPGEDGDDFLDALLGMDTLGVGETVKWPETEAEAGVFAGGVTGGVGGEGGVGGGASAGATGSKKRAQGGGAGKKEAWGAGSRAPFVTEDGGDSVLDDLLGLELGIPPTSAAAAEGALISPNQSDDLLFSAPAGTAATTGETPTAAGILREGFAASPNEAVGDGRREGGGGDQAVAAVAPAPPFDGAELGRLCTHLNDRNRRAKRLAQRCQEMFLRLFFKVQQRVCRVLIFDTSGRFVFCFCLYFVFVSCVRNIFFVYFV